VKSGKRKGERSSFPLGTAVFFKGGGGESISFLEAEPIKREDHQAEGDKGKKNFYGASALSLGFLLRQKVRWLQERNLQGVLRWGLGENSGKKCAKADASEIRIKRRCSMGRAVRRPPIWRK